MIRISVKSWYTYKYFFVANQNSWYYFVNYFLQKKIIFSWPFFLFFSTLSDDEKELIHTNQTWIMFIAIFCYRKVFSAYQIWTSNVKYILLVFVFIHVQLKSHMVIRVYRSTSGCIAMYMKRWVNIRQRAILSSRFLCI